MSQKRIRFLKRWGEFLPGEGGLFDRRKANTLIKGGFAIEVSPKPRAETATIQTTTETADAPPALVKKSKKSKKSKK